MRLLVRVYLTYDQECATANQRDREINHAKLGEKSTKTSNQSVLPMTITPFDEKTLVRKSAESFFFFT